MKRRVANRAAALCLLLPFSSLSVSVAAAEIGQNNIWMKGGAGTANQSPETKEVPAADRQVGATMREDAATDERYGRGRRSVALWRSSSSGVFNKRSGTVSKYLTVSAIAAAVIMLSRLGGALSSCLAEIGVLKPRGGPVADSAKNGVCKELIEDVSASDDRKPVTSLARNVLSLRLPGSISNQVLTAVMLFAVLAIGFAAPPPPGSEGREVAEPEATGDDTAASDEEELKDVYPVVEFKGDVVVVGKTWKTDDGPDQQGTTPPFRFFLQNKMYETFPTAETKKVLQQEGLLERVREILSKAPARKTGDTDVFIWGQEGGDSVRVLDSDVTADDSDIVVARCEVFLPAGAFGFQPGKDGGDDEAQGLSDLWNALRAVVHVIKTGKSPSE